MGIGDEIMLSGIAKRIHAATNEPVVFVSANGQQRADPVWDNLDYIAQRGAPASSFVFAGRGKRPYYSHMEGSRVIYRKWDKRPGEIRLTDEEREWARGFDLPERFLVVGHQWKSTGGGGRNKDWARWGEFADAFKDLPLVQCGFFQDGFMSLLAGVQAVRTPTFRHACAVLERSIGYVGHEGGLHHAAAALGKPAVVVFGGYISPEVTGYDFHTNLYVPSPEYPLGCGSVVRCEHCRRAMDSITVEDVVAAARKMIGEQI